MKRRAVRSLRCGVGARCDGGRSAAVLGSRRTWACACRVRAMRAWCGGTRAVATLLAVLLAVAAAATRIEQDFEFDDDAPATDESADVMAAADGAAFSRKPRRYVYDPHNTLCRSLVCKKREVCLLRDAFTALCANKKDILRKGDVIVSAGESESESESETEDVLYVGEGEARCVGCGGGARAQFLCGSDNRTYSSLCRLDLHNCVRRAAPPVRLACRGFCPCRGAPHRPHRPHAPRRPHQPHRTHRTHPEWQRRKAEPMNNEVLPERSSRRRYSQGAGGCSPDRMADRLLDWFSVLMEEAGGVPPPPPAPPFPPDCKAEVRWMFAHLDTDGDGLLSAANLYALRHDERERCLRPFLAGCGAGEGEGEGSGGALSRGAWCGCLRRAARPCEALARAVGARAARGGYVPACDARGYYRPRQCHAALGVCWCVDAHGAETPGSRTKGEAPCAAAAPPAPAAPSDDEDAAGGSGDGLY